MTEATQVNDAIRRHLGPLGAFRRLEVPGARGWPDWHWTMRRRSGWIEAKLFEPNGQPRKLTREQVDFGLEEVRHGGSWHLVGLQPRNRTWFVYDVVGAVALLNGNEATPVLTSLGAFPTRDVVRVLMGTDARVEEVKVCP